MNQNSKSIKPFIKWAGGKYRLSEQLIDYLLSKFDVNKNKYIEPMVGSGGFFFRLFPNYAYLSDINKNLIITYKIIKSDVEGLITLLSEYKKLHVDKDFLLAKKNFLTQLLKTIVMT